MADEEVAVPDKISSKDVEKSSSERRRATSPYHERCFPGYCESAAAVDKQTLSKMKRADLEDKYIVYADENLALKKRIRDHEKQIQRLTVALARQDQADRKTGVKTAYDTVRAENLESQNKTLQAKVKVLTQQLMNHSYIHSKENRLAEDRGKKSSPQPSHRDVSQSARESPVRKPEDSDNLKQRIVALEQMLEAQKKKYKTRISQLEKELAATPKTSADLGDQISQHSKQLNDNLEIIKLRRQNNEMAEKLDALKDQLTINEKELSEVRDAMKKVTEKSEDLEEKLKQEKEKAREAQGLAVKSVSNTEIIRGLEEQIRDLQKEKELLKETNEKLLEITTGPQSKSERSIHEAKLKQQISLLENRLKDKIKELEEKEEQFMKMEALYEENKTRTPKQVKSNTGSEKSHHKEEIERLKEQLILALGENEDMKKTLDMLKANMEEGTQDEKDDKDNSELLKENENLRQELENLRSQGAQETDELKSKLAVALLEIEDLKKQLNDAGEMVPKSDYELLKTQLDEALKENLDLKHELEQNTQGQEVVAKDSKLEKELEEANNEIIRLRHAVEEQMQGQEVVAKDSKLEKDLEEANNEIIRLRLIVEEQMQGQEVVAKYNQLEKDLEEANKEIIMLRNVVEELMQGEGDGAKDIKLMEALEEANNELIRLRRIVDEQMQARESDDRDSTVEKELAEAIIEINRLRVIADEHAQCEQRPATPCKSERSTSTTLIEKSRPSTPKSEQSVHSAQPSSHNIEQSRPNTPTKSEKSVRLEPSSHCVVNKVSSHKGGEDVEELKAQLCSALIENQQLRKALEQCDPEPTKVVVKDSKLQNELASALSEVERLKKIAVEHEHCPKSCTQLVPQKSKVTIVEKTPQPSPVQSKTGSLSKSPPLKSYSEHQIEEIPPEPVHKPNLVIVSKHEFDAILLKKKKFYTESEVTVLDDGKEVLNCRMEICMYDLEMDQDMLDYLRDIEEDPHVFLDWSFLGLDQRTIAMPASQALFHTNVVYYGPLSQNMSEYMKENTMPICLMLAKSKTEGVMVGSGELDLFPAIKNPGRAYMRGVHFKVKKGSATVYCSFKMHGCCPGEPSKGESIEVGIGHLQLNNADDIPDKSTHLYVEYSLLGYCGGELETDSIPKSEVMRFNYTKRLRVNDHNASKLEPLLQRDNPEPLKFTLLSEPCSLSKGTEVEEVGTAQINLMKDMVEKDKDVVSAQLPVTNKNGEELGRLSVTIIGIDTLLEHTEHKKKEKER